jgi:serine/threonine protein kinase
LFTGSNSEIVKKNYKCIVNFTDDMKKKMTPAEFELLARMLDPSPKTRITPTEALNHNYF